VWRSKVGTPRTLPKSVNGESDHQVIAETFSTYFESACSHNSISRNEELYNEYCSKRIKYNHFGDIQDYVISTEMMDSLILKLKAGKAAGLDNLTADHLKNAHPIIVQLLRKLLSLILIFEYVPDSFGKGIMIPIPKNNLGKGDIQTDEFRGITINPIISKLFEQCLLIVFDRYLSSSNMQFGFKAKSSCSHALYTIRKTIEFFIERQSTVNICGLDLAKAFDKMNRYALFLKLMDRKCPVNLINILECWFSKVFVCVKWGDYISAFVYLRCGTRQGGVASPTLFAVCINDVITKLQKSSLGCHIRGVCFNALMYADDLLLVAISIGDLQRMIDICKMELDWLDMTINIKKSVGIRIGPRFDVVASHLVLENRTINWCTEMPYLGVVIKSAKSFRCCIHAKKIKFYRSLNGILGKIGLSPKINVTLSLIESHCNPILLYCLDALKLNKTDIKGLSHPYNSAYMKLFSSFDKNVITLCQYYSGQLPLTHLVDCRTLNFYSRINISNYCPASILYNWFGKQEFYDIALKYGISDQDHRHSIKNKISAEFYAYANSLM
jgi:Reverse transcriptase (RNA-dependent DNA polymerase)